MMKEGLAQTVFDSDPWTVDKGVTKLDVFEPVMSKSKMVHVILCF